MTGHSHPVLGIVFDLGGTSLRAAAVDAAGDIVSTTVGDTPSVADGTPDDQLIPALVSSMSDMSSRLCGDGNDVRALSLAFPGPVRADGVPLNAPTVWQEQVLGPSLLTALHKAWSGTEIFIVNDVAAAGYHLVAQGRRDFLLTTVSSGIGAQLFTDAVPVGGAYGGEIGHLRLPDEEFAGVDCECGGSAHLGAVCSGRGTLEMARRRIRQDPQAFRTSWLHAQGISVEGLTTYDIVAAFHAEDPWTMRLIDATAQPLGRILATVHAAAGTTDFPIMGGFAMALGEEYCRILARHARNHCHWLDQDWDAMIGLLDHEQPGLAGNAWYLAQRFSSLSGVRHA